MTDRPITVLLLAAGRGQRLAPYTEVRPKCLVEVGDQTLLSRHLALAARFGATRVAVVTGHLAETIDVEIARIRPSVDVCCIPNPDYLEGSIVSLRRGLDGIDGDLIYMDADVLYHPDVLARLFQTHHASAILVDGGGSETGEEMVVGAREGRAIHIGRRYNANGPWQLAGESVGFVRVAAAAVQTLRRALDETIDAAGPKQEWEAGAARFFQMATVAVESIDGLPWTEIDFADDLRHAREEIWPQLPPL